MPVETTSGVPSQVAAGTTARFSVDYTDYPADEWSLSFSLLGGSALTVSGVPTDGEFVVTLSAAQTASLTPGQYTYSIKVTETSGGDVAEAARGTLVVTPDYSNTTVGPWRTRYNAAIQAMSDLSSGYQSVSVEGQSFTSHTIDQLQKWIYWLESKAIEEDKMLGRATSGGLKRIQTRF